MKAKALVLNGDGINCDVETHFALEAAGFAPEKIHTTELLSNPQKLSQCKLLVFPGGFSFGDEIASGKVLGIELKQRINAALHEFIDKNGFVLGICNGFQILTQLGILPVSDKGAKKIVSLARNSGGKFINRWVTMSVTNQDKSPFFTGLGSIDLPIRHGEGRLSLGASPNSEDIKMVRDYTVLQYKEDINGSFEKAAALTNTRGTVLGLMPHPEAFIRWSQHPCWGQFAKEQGNGNWQWAAKGSEEPHGLTILKNAAKAIN